MSTPSENSSAGQETAIFAGGCFWGVEDLLRNIPGVIKTRVGYTGGNTPNPHYESVKSGITGHTEAVKIIFDPAKVSYAALLDFFFKMHDPTTLNRQGNDRGSQYRSAVYYLSEDQKAMALEKIKEWELAGFWKGSIVTEVTKAGPFYDAEEYHQDYLVKNPGGYTCHYYRDF
jgi:methionine-S-sulfoxide reductase